MRKCHYWKRAGAASAPSEIIVFDCETWHGDRARVDGGEWQTLRLGVALAYRLERGKRTRVRELVFRDEREFWSLVESRLSATRPVWVVGHNLPFDLGVVSGWRVICGDRYTTHKAAVSGQMFFIKGCLDGKPLNFCDTVNYYRCSLRSLGRAVGIHKGEMPPQEADDSQWVDYCRQDVVVTAAGLDHLIAFTRKEMLGPWQPSIASLSFSAFRSRFMRHKVLVHDYRNALDLERGAYYGGVVETAFIGKVPASPVWELDVCSMFPACARMPLPYHYVHCSDRIGCRRVEELMKDYSVIADVDIDSPTTQYPVRIRQGTYHPVGRFRTTLAHPELEVAIQAGHVRRVHRAAWYRKAPILKEYMEYFVGRKEQYRAQGNDAFATLCKYFANSLYGKTGQLTPRWQEWGRDSLQVIEEANGLPIGTFEAHYGKPPDLYEMEELTVLPGVEEGIPTRNYYGVVEIQTCQTESRDSCPAIAATITSAARVLLRSYHRIAGSGHWFYSDTDSVWVDAVGKANLEAAGVVGENELGKLSVKESHEWLDIHGPKDYQTDRVCRIKGLKATATPDGSGGFLQLHFPGPLAQIKQGRVGGVFVAQGKKRLHRRITRCLPGSDGFTTPLVFPRDCPGGKGR